MQGEQADAILRDLAAVLSRECNQLQELRDLAFEQRRVTSQEETAQAGHRLRVAVIGRALGPQPLHQFAAAESVDDLVDVRDAHVARQLALDTVLFERVAVPA